MPYVRRAPTARDLPSSQKNHPSPKKYVATALYRGTASGGGRLDRDGIGREISFGEKPHPFQKGRREITARYFSLRHITSIRISVPRYGCPYRWPETLRFSNTGYAKYQRLPSGLFGGGAFPRFRALIPRPSLPPPEAVPNSTRGALTTSAPKTCVATISGIFRGAHHAPRGITGSRNRVPVWARTLTTSPRAFGQLGGGRFRPLQRYCSDCCI